MASNTVATGTSGQLYIYAAEVAYSNAGNWSDIYWELYLLENGGSNLAWNSGIPANVTAVFNGADYGAIWAGAFSYDWRPGGNQGTLIASSTTRVGHMPDGTSSIYLQGNIGNTGSGSAGGPTSVGVWVPYTVTRVIPNTPTGVTGTRVSDTQTQLAWAQSSPSNGQPVYNIIQRRVNNGAWDAGVTVSATTAAQVNSSPNQKIEYRVAANNSAGTSAYSVPSAPVYTTPGAPTNALAAKNAGLDINISFTENVDYAEHTHEVWHGTVLAGVTTWDGAALTTLASGVTSYTHVAPDASKVHVYRVRSKAGALTSAYATSNSVQLLAPPNKPTIPAMPAFADKAADLIFSWIHNPVDTTPQTAYEFAYSTNGGSSWTSTGKLLSSAVARTILANTHAANVALTMRVRTWGSASTGGSEGTGASPWSDLKTVTYKTVPSATIVSPANGSTINESTLRVTLGFSQPEAAAFVKAQLELWTGGVMVETLESTILVGITMATPVQNGEDYIIKARVQDSNGLWSAWVNNSFDVLYLAPVPAGVVLTYLPDTGFGQLDINIPAPGVGQAAAVSVTISRTIDGMTETIVQDYPVEEIMTFLDTTPTIHGTNSYSITTTSALGAQTTITADLVTTECRRAYLSKGPGFEQVGVFGGNLSVGETLSVASETVAAAGRIKPIGLYGVETSVQLKVNSFVFEREGFSTIDELRALLLVPGKACYRDSSGRRVFGTAKGSIQYKKVNRGDLSFTLTETS